MSRHERWGERDLAFSRWHRSLEGDLDWIDLDYVGYCHTCREPLFVMELARYVGQTHKATTVTRKIADRLDVPALLVFYEKEGDAIVRFRVQRVAPRWSDTYTVEPRGLEEWIRRQHDQHICACLFEEQAA
jgi:hypothetical protein